MREIKFRGWHMFQDNGDIVYQHWAYGYYFNHFGTDSHSIYLMNGEGSRIVDKETVGQYTGLKDKNGVEIYEGDIVERGRGEIFFDTKRAQFRVRWHDTIWLNVRGNNPMYQGGEPIFGNHEIVFEVIGNIYEHPELLK